MLALLRSLDNCGAPPRRFRARDARSQQYISDCVSPLHANRSRVREAQPLSGRRRPTRDGWHDIDSVLVPGRLARPGGLGRGSRRSRRLSLTVDGPRPRASRPATAISPSAPRTPWQAWLIARWRCGYGSPRAFPMAPGSEGARRMPQPCCAAGVAWLESLGGPDRPERRSRRRARHRQRHPGPARAVGAAGYAAAAIASTRSGWPLHLAVASTGPSSQRRHYAAVLPAEIRDDGRADRVSLKLLADRAGRRHDLMGSALEPAACRANPALASALRRRGRTSRAPVASDRQRRRGILASHAPATRHRDLPSDARSGFKARACRTVG